MTQQFFIGVDGGATKCTVRVEDEAGNLLGQETSGSANIRISIDQSWRSIHTALNKILNACAISLDNKQYRFHTGIGVAGCEFPETYHAFINHLNDRDAFTTFVVTSDAHVACLGAHGGKDGAVIIAGTGVVGYQICANKTKKVSGWGFPYDDQGGGAWLGLQAITLTLQWLDGRHPGSKLTESIFASFQHDQNRLINWMYQAHSTAFAEFAPYVIRQSEEGDATAISIMQKAGQAIDKVSEALDALPCALIGGVAPFLLPFLSVSLRSRLRTSIATPAAGATLLIREHIAKSKER